MVLSLLYLIIESNQLKLFIEEFIGMLLEYESLLIWEELQKSIMILQPPSDKITPQRR